MELGGKKRGTTWYGQVSWSALIAAATGFLLCAFDLMVDPVFVSGVWMDVLGWEPFWWWKGGTYLPELQVWQGAGGIPTTNFVGWVVVPFIIIFVFQLFFQQRDRVTEKLVNAIPFLIYGYLYYTIIGAALEMSWYDPGLHQAVLIGTFTMGPVILLGAIKLFKDYSRPA